MSHRYHYNSRRSVVYARNGMVATSQPLAAQAGLDALKAGGSAADAAIAAAAMLNVVEPVSTGIGGDAFCLYWESAKKRVHALNGSGRAPAAASIKELRDLGYTRMPIFSGHTVTVPGAVAAWCDLLARFGRLPREQVLAAAITTAEEGYPVSEVIADSWKLSEAKLRRSIDWQCPDKAPGPEQPSGHELLINGRAPWAGEVMRIPTLGSSLRLIAEGGKDAFYRDKLAQRICDHVQAYDGWVTLEDFATHESEWVEPISVDYRGVKVWECPPNGQGLAALIALGLLETFDVAEMSDVERTHTMIECMRLGFADALRWVADPRRLELPVERLLSHEYARERSSLIQGDQRILEVCSGIELPAGDDTIYVSVVDSNGNAASFINSLYMGTGTGLVVPGTGISLQNRGANFSLTPNHPNALAPSKRPYHTIIPALATRNDELLACFGVMGGFMQPQGHMQVISHLVDIGATPQGAMDAARWQVEVSNGRIGDSVMVEPELGQETIEGLTARGHSLKTMDGFHKLHMGGGQVITRDPKTGVLAGGSDPRKDGCVAGY